MVADGEDGSIMWISAAAVPLETLQRDARASRATDEMSAATLSCVRRDRDRSARRPCDRSIATDPAEIDFVLNDGFPMRALNIVKLLASRIRPGGMVLTDDVGGFRGYCKDYLVYLRDRANGFDSMLIPLMGGTEYSVRR
ncbi:hypothetical protein NB311A_08959 [Nitrobacter sp. Nb-311A]|nr:hypothetical protein NB311A_08959 [Nitrobacter sp. Nb-311A]